MEQGVKAFRTDPLLLVEMIEATAPKVRMARERAKRRRKHPNPVRGMTAEKRAEVLGLLASGWSQRRVARHLQMSDNTVRKLADQSES